MANIPIVYCDGRVQISPNLCKPLFTNDSPLKPRKGLVSVDRVPVVDL